MSKGQFPKGSFPGWRTMTAAERYNARMHAIFAWAKSLKAEVAAQKADPDYEGAPHDPIAYGAALAAKAARESYDPTCALCESGEEPATTCGTIGSVWCISVRPDGAVLYSEAKIPCNARGVSVDTYAKQTAARLQDIADTLNRRSNPNGK